MEVKMCTAISQVFIISRSVASFQVPAQSSPINIVSSTTAPPNCSAFSGIGAQLDQESTLGVYLHTDVPGYIGYYFGSMVVHSLIPIATYQAPHDTVTIVTMSEPW